MPLTPAQLEQLKKRCNSLKVEYLAQCIMSGDVSLNDLPLNSARRDALEQMLSTIPNSEEQKNWQEICSVRESGSVARLESLLNQYVVKWQALLPPRNHVEEASHELFSIMEGREQAAWEQVDQSDYDALCSYLRSHPVSPYVVEAEEKCWVLASETLSGMQRYLNDFPAGCYVEEARSRIAAYTEWERIRYAGTTFDLVNYVNNNPASPYIADARKRLNEKKEETLSEMQYYPSNFRLSDVQGLINNGVITQSDLLSRGIVTPDLMKRIINAPKLVPPVLNTVPDIDEANRATDIYLFGVPSSGKTCVLSGMLGSSKWSNIDYVAFGAQRYINYLQMCRTHGIVPERTYGNFISLIRTEVMPDRGGAVHRVNLIDMAGEDFATKIVMNPDGHVCFEDMGVGVTELMQNDNRKVFFIVIDPAADGIIYFERKDENGIPVVGPDGAPVRDATQQDIILNSMISMIFAPENKKILQKVDAIHFIMSKADLLGSPAERDTEALRRFNKNYGQSIKSLIESCQKCGINSGTGGRPVLHTFSLGSFHIGGIYNYNPTDSDKLVNIFSQITRGVGSGWRLRFS